jgi:hypothetical protein
MMQPGLRQTREERQQRRRSLFNRKFGQLLRLSSNIETNERDHAFAKPETPQLAAREIIYVFDQSVMEMFMALDDDTRKYPAAFHLRDWRSPIEINDTNIEKVWEAINRQTAIIAGEYLLSGGLPGQADGQFYMTREHYEEFCRAVDRLTRQAAKVHENDPDAIVTELSELRKALIETTPGHPDLDPYLDRDVRALFGQDIDTNEEALTEFRKTRAIALALSQAKDYMQMRQIDRATSREMLGRIVPLDMRFPDPRDRSAYEKLKRDILHELRESNRLRPAPERNDANLKRDAEAIAQVQWIAREQRTSEEQIVFVTGDALLASTYLRWHKDFIVKQPGEPRVIRHIQQFAAILNLGDMDNSITGTKHFFEMLREGVETPLVAFNLSRDRQSLEDAETFDDPEASRTDLDTKLAHRFDLELRLQGVFESYEPIDLFFKKRLTLSWHKENQKSFNNIAESFRTFERLAIGLSTHYVERRAQAVLDDVRSWDDGADLVQSAKAYIERLFERITEQTVDLWFPVALENLGRSQLATSLIARTPLRLSLEVPTERGPQQLVSVVDEWLAGNDVKGLISGPLHSIRHLVFAIVSVAELRLGSWGRANRYAELAMSAAVSPLKTDRATGKTIDALQTEEYQELRFLRALSCRMRIGAAGPKDMAGDDVWASWLDEGVRQLNAYEVYHAQRQQVGNQFRAISERAALRGFYASWLPILAKRLAGRTPASRDRGYSPDRAILEFDHLMADLSEALNLAAQLDASGKTVLDASVSIQVYANVAASYALTRVCPSYSLTVFEGRLGRARIDEVARWWRNVLNSDDGRLVIQRVPPLVRKQLAVFFLDNDIAPPSDGNKKESRAPRLDLDDAMLDLLAGLASPQPETPSPTSPFADT